MVVDRSVASGLSDVPGQASGSRLAVGAGDEDAAMAQAGRQASRQARGDGVGHQARESGATTEAQATAEDRRYLGRRHRCCRAQT